MKTNDMTKVSQRVTIVPSDSLAGMHLAGIIGRRGTIAEQVSGAAGRLIGYMVCLDKPFQGECLWFVPQDAVQDEENTR